MSNLKPAEVKNLNIKKKNDLASSFKEDTVSGILDLSNRSKLILVFIFTCRPVRYACKRISQMHKVQ